VNIIKDLVPESKYSIKCPYSMKPTRIVVHNTANNASARNEIAYMKRNDNTVSFHYAVDDKEVVQGIPENRNSWNAGDGSNGKGNREGISIEICYSLSGGDKFIKAEQNAVDLIVDILKRYNWGIDKVTKHQDYNGKYCPHRTLDMGWTRFINMIKVALDEEPLAEKPVVEKPVTTSAIKKGALVSIKKGSKYYTGKTIPDWVLGLKWYVASVKGDRAVINKSEDGKYSINSPINVSCLTIATKTTAKTIKVGSTVKVNKGAKTYDGKSLASFVYGRKHKVKELKGNRAVITYLGITVCAIDVKNLTLA
jgi:N-acetylmuramoyl-L-alanine amidase CwlA